MIQPKTLQSSYSQIITVAKNKHNRVKKSAKIALSFSFITQGQWILLILLQGICISFIVFTTMLIP